MNEKEKLTFFSALHGLAHSDENRMEMLQLSENVKSRFQYYDINTMQKVTTKRNITDLVLIAMGKNQQHVKAIATHSRRPRGASKTAVSKKYSDE